MKTFICGFMVGLFASLLVWSYGKEIQFRDWQNSTLDNHSFAAGVWCAQMAIKNGHAEFTTNRFHQKGGFSPTGLNHSEILYAARCHAITNGWGEFNNRVGFKGTEGKLRK